MSEKKFRELCDEVIEEENRILALRDDEYNRATVDIPDFFDSIDDPEKAVFAIIWIKILRLKSHILDRRPNEEDKRIEDIVDARNYLKFLYGLIREKQLEERHAERK